ncbi:MAG: RNA 2',3'-cyclic phosphodiesterase [Candidatus Heimdallarchaeaceae archaeon]
MVRTFISVDFDNLEIKTNIEKIQISLLQTGAALKVVKTDLLHLTLAFIGEVSEEEITLLKEILDSLSFTKFELTVKNPSVLPNENYIRVIYCSIDGDVPVLMNLQNELKTKLKKAGFRVEKRPFKAHLTIARVKSPKNKQELLDKIKEYESIYCGKQVISNVKLKKSVLKKEGPEYTTLHKVSLENNII